MTDSYTIEANKSLVEEFPFLLPISTLTDKVPKNYDYSYTNFDLIPEGWRKAFGIKLCKELKEVLIKEKYLEKYRICEIKEKYGRLRWYDFGHTNPIWEVLSKYEKLSAKTCIVCGEPATKISLGYISPYCDDCAKKEENLHHIEFIPIKNYTD